MCPRPSAFQPFYKLPNSVTMWRRIAYFFNLSKEKLSKENYRKEMQNGLPVKVTSANLEKVTAPLLFWISSDLHAACKFDAWELRSRISN